MTTTLLLVSALALAFANGANDTGKPVASLIAAGILPQRRALRLAAFAGLAGSVAAIWWAVDLSALFAGRGLVDETTRAQAPFASSVTAGAAVAVLLASRLGLPVSTTHALLGAMLGSGMALHGTIAWSSVVAKTAAPLILSPLLAALLAGVAAPAFRRWATPASDPCLCTMMLAPALAGPSLPTVVAAATATCQSAGAREIMTGSRLVRGSSLATAFGVAVARSVNDTPKLAALMLTPAALPFDVSPMLVAGVAVAIGGAFCARRVTNTMATQLVRLDGREAEASTATLISSVLIFCASPLGPPVSTTHITTGALAGVGATAGRLSWRWMRTILAAWVTTLPVAALGGAGLALLLR